MQAVTLHFQHVTGRPFYGLAAVMYSAPVERTVYHPGGHVIERWAVDVPGWTTLFLILASATLLVIVERRRSRPAPVVLCVVWHAIVAVAFFAMIFWYSINITGLFI